MNAGKVIKFLSNSFVLSACKMKFENSEQLANHVKKVFLSKFLIYIDFV